MAVLATWNTLSLRVGNREQHKAIPLHMQDSKYMLIQATCFKETLENVLGLGTVRSYITPGFGKRRLVSDWDELMLPNPNRKLFSISVKRL